MKNNFEKKNTLIPTFKKSILLIGILNFINVNAYDNDHVNGFTDTGWYPPLVNSSMVTDDCCTYDSYTYENNWDASHTGVDIGMDEVTTGDEVYAISDGTIIGRRLHCNDIGSGNPDTYNLSVILVEHTSSSGDTFTAVYGHTAPSDMNCENIATKYNENTENIAISKGDVIGTLEDYGDTHLHFGLAVDATVNTLFSGWGRDDENISDYWRNPETYLSANTSQILTSEESIYDFIQQEDWKYFKINSGGANLSSVKIDLNQLNDDVDLYVKKGEKPSESDYDCRPYSGGVSSETCELTLNSSIPIFIGIHGYRSSNFAITAMLTETDNSVSIESIMDECIIKYFGYFGNKVGSSYTCYGDYLCQNTTGGTRGDAVRIAIRNDLYGNEFFYYWGGWSRLSLDYCE